MSVFTRVAAVGLMVATASLGATGASALGVPLSGTFTFEAYNYNPSDDRRLNSAATRNNFEDIAGLNGIPTIGSVNSAARFQYVGALDFRQPHNGDNITTIRNWLGTALDSDTDANFNAAFTNLDGANTSAGFQGFLGSTLSAGGGSGDGGAGGSYVTATLFKITASALNISDLGKLYEVNHDDGVTFEGANGTSVDYPGPNAEKNRQLWGRLEGGADDFTLFYASANGNPSVLEVQAIAMPLPATAWMLLAASGGLLAAARRRKRTPASA